VLRSKVPWQYPSLAPCSRMESRACPPRSSSYCRPCTEVQAGKSVFPSISATSSYRSFPQTLWSKPLISCSFYLPVVLLLVLLSVVEDHCFDLHREVQDRFIALLFKYFLLAPERVVEWVPQLRLQVMGHSLVVLRLPEFSYSAISLIGSYLCASIIQRMCFENQAFIFAK
jgi:hypothetical protein